MKTVQASLSCLFSLLSGLFLTACASAQLNYNTLDLASSTNNLVTKQVLYNFAAFLDDPAAIPAQVTVSSGNATTSNSVSPTLTTPVSTGVTTTRLLSGAPTVTLADAVASKSVSVAATDSWNQSWSFSPVTDPERMKRLQALYRYAVDWSEDGARGEAYFIANFPPIQRSVSYTSPTCILASNGTPVTFKFDKTGQEFCATATTGTTNAIPFTKAATTQSYTDQMDDPYYLTNPDCIVCGLRKRHRYINPNIAGPWLRWRNITGPNHDPIRIPQPGDVSIGFGGHYEFFTSAENAEYFVNFTVAVLAATGQAGSTSTATASTSAGSQAAGASKSVTLLDNLGNPFTLIIPGSQ
jgi:hypothetical protein